MNKKELCNRWALSYIELTLFYLPYKKSTGTNEYNYFVGFQTSIDWLNYGPKKIEGLFYFFDSNFKLINDQPTSAISLPRGTYYVVQSNFYSGAKIDNNVYKISLDGNGFQRNFNITNEQILYELTFGFEDYTGTIGKKKTYTIYYSYSPDFSEYHTMPSFMFDKTIKNKLNISDFKRAIRDKSLKISNLNEISTHVFIYDGKQIYVKYCFEESENIVDNKKNAWRTVFNIAGENSNYSYKQLYSRTNTVWDGECSASMTSSYGDIVSSTIYHPLHEPLSVCMFLPKYDRYNYENSMYINVLEENLSSTSDFIFCSFYEFEHGLSTSTYTFGKPFFLNEDDYIGDMPNQLWETTGNFDFIQHCCINKKDNHWSYKSEYYNSVDNSYWFGDIYKNSERNADECKKILESGTIIEL